MRNKGGEGQMFFPLQEGEIVSDVPKLNLCFICKAWHLEKELHPIEVPDQAGYVRKLACGKCIDEILGKKKEHGSDDSC